MFGDEDRYFWVLGFGGCLYRLLVKIEISGC